MPAVTLCDRRFRGSESAGPPALHGVASSRRTGWRRADFCFPSPVALVPKNHRQRMTMRRRALGPTGYLVGTLACPCQDLARSRSPYAHPLVGPSRRAWREDKRRQDRCQTEDETSGHRIHTSISTRRKNISRAEAVNLWLLSEGPCSINSRNRMRPLPPRLDPHTEGPRFVTGRSSERRRSWDTSGRGAGAVEPRAALSARPRARPSTLAANAPPLTVSCCAISGSSWRLRSPSACAGGRRIQSHGRAG